MSANIHITRLGTARQQAWRQGKRFALVTLVASMAVAGGLVLAPGNYSLLLWVLVAGAAVLALASMTLASLVAPLAAGRLGARSTTASAVRKEAEVVTVSQAVQPGGAATVRAEIDMTQGDLQVVGGAAHVMNATFAYDIDHWRQPQVQYGVDNRLGHLTVSQRATFQPSVYRGRNSWFVRLNDDLPLDLRVSAGSGAATLRLGNLPLRHLTVLGGVGDMLLDLDGEWKQNFSAFIKAGIGDLNLRLPSKVGVRVAYHEGMTNLLPGGLTLRDGYYVNAVYGKSAITLDIRLVGSLGTIELTEAEVSFAA